MTIGTTPLGMLLLVLDCCRGREELQHRRLHLNIISTSLLLLLMMISCMLLFSIHHHLYDDAPFEQQHFFFLLFKEILDRIVCSEKENPNL
jgi:hypothetical protein